MRLVVELCPGNPGEARAIYASLKAEEAQPSPKRGRVSVALDEGRGCVVIELEPRDLGSMRALMNSFLYLAHAAYNAVREAGGMG
ncbi:KEOPS complex subunit Pcc1 [Stetteria hydrogenophila]